MEEPQKQQEAAAPVQVMDQDLTNTMGWELLLEITGHMDAAGRSSWRLVSKAACQAVYDSTAALAPCSTSTGSTTALLPPLLTKCSGIKRLSCFDLPHFKSISGLLQLPPRLEALNISCTDVRDLSFVARCTSLRRLTAGDAHGRPGLQFRMLPAVIQQLPGLTSLTLTCDALRVDAARAVAAALPHLGRLEQLGISWLNPDAAAALLPALPLLPGLRRLDLRCCDLQQAGTEALLPAALQLPRLRHLSLHRNQLWADGLAPALGRLTRLDSLVLCANSIESRLTRFRSLVLGADGLRDEGVTAVAPAIQQLTGLTSLSLGNTGFSQAGAQALAPALLHLTRLQTLALYHNQFGPQGAALLAPALQELTGLRSLLLFSTSLGAEGVAALAPALQHLTMLRHLDLSHNQLGPEGLHALLPGIQQLVGLRCLDLQRNALDRDSNRDSQSLHAFAAGIHRLSGLHCLGLSAAELRPGFAHTLARVIQDRASTARVPPWYD